MSTVTNQESSEARSSSLPPSLRKQLSHFRQYVWRTKILEVFGIAAIGLGLGFLILFGIDRWYNTSMFVRLAIAVCVAGLWLLLPWALHRWVWKHRRFDQLARLIRRRTPTLGDELLGVIELSENKIEQSRSPRLCAAAIQQVADHTSRRNLLNSAPTSRHATWLRLAAGLGVSALLTLVVVPRAAWTSLMRLAAPWSQIDRYTFVQLEPLPDRLVVAHGEAFTLEPKLLQQTRWSPKLAKASIAYQPDVSAVRHGEEYPLQFAALDRSAWLNVRIGDYTHRTRVEPKLRPELLSIEADVQLPSYLQLPPSGLRDVRGGSLTVVAGSGLRLVAAANRELASASMQSIPKLSVSDASDLEISRSIESPVANRQIPASKASVAIGLQGAKLQTDWFSVEEGMSQYAMEWEDADGLGGRQPLPLSIQGIPDAAPLVSAENLPRNTIVLNSDQLNFQIIANDDFGVKEVGLEWWSVDQNAIENDPSLKPTSLDWRLLADGAPDRTSLLSQGTFRPIDWGIESQEIALKAWAVDYLPGRERSYSSVHHLFVMRPDEHAIWITEQLNQWHRQALEVRDRELQLYEINRELHALRSEDLELPENRRRIEDQAAAETANERRLRGLAGTGQLLLKQAARNPELGVGHIERWAEMLKLMQDISNQRMPKVSDLLKQAAQAAAGNASKKSGPAVGNIRNASAGSGGPAKDEDSQGDKPQVPKLVDVESSLEPPKAGETTPDDASKKSSGSKFTLPTTTLIGPHKKPGEKQEEPQEAVAEAVREQADLLAEFDRLADELGQILGDLEGSTLVKRLKASSRDQLEVAQEISKRLGKLLQTASTSRTPQKTDLEDLVAVEAQGSAKVSNIVDDLEAFQDRRRLAKFQTVLDEMKSSQVVGALRQLSDELPKEHGMSIAQAEYWADTLDRWAEDLVDPACQGKCPGSKNNDSLPPSIVLEVLQILEGQVNLREETRVVEQARQPDNAEQHQEDARRLWNRQTELDQRVVAVNEKIQALPDGSQRFPDEIDRLSKADVLMQESIDILAKPETGKPSIAVQTEIIELILESKRVNPNSGGGGGGTPGGGGQGMGGDAALALVGAGLDMKAKLEERETSQATGATGSVFPEEFRDGLNQYFQQFETRRP